jgi:hypothetical protein
MKFEGSHDEANLNDIWNKTVVHHDCNLRVIFNGERFFRPSVDILQGILLYYNSVMNFISNSFRRCAKYDDREYLLNYLRQSGSDAIKDLGHYRDTILRRGLHTGHDVIINDYIKIIEETVESLAKIKGHVPRSTEPRV